MRTKASKLITMVFVIMIAAHSAQGASESRYEKLIGALMQVESHGNDWAIGDRQMKERAYGSLQIRKPCVDDVNRHCGTKIRAEELLGNRSLSAWVCQKYLETYATRERLGREPGEEDLARIWNGGPNGYRKESTRQYWSKVHRALLKQNE